MSSAASHTTQPSIKRQQFGKKSNKLLLILILFMQDQRLFLLQEWLTHHFASQHFTIQPITGDASFRRYFRVEHEQQTYIAMDAPPDREDCKPFIAIALAFARLGVQVPHIFTYNLDYGFLLLTDLGDRLYLGELTLDNFVTLYKKALLVLNQIHACDTVENWSLPHFGPDFLLREWQLYIDWVVERHWQIKTSVHEHHLLANTFELLVNAASSQPQVCVHRDYHSRNLLCLANDGVGVLDFQDAVWGPITYDAVSLLRDCYIDWPRQEIEKILALYYQQLCDAGQLKNRSLAEFTRWFDLMGIQRNLKALGIFARLKHLYDRPNYLQYIPRGLNYVLQVSENYPELNSFRQFLQHSANAEAEKQIIL
jgi:hypothetical protein